MPRRPQRDDVGLGEEREDDHGRCAARAGESVEVEDSHEELRPRGRTPAVSGGGVGRKTIIEPVDSLRRIASEFSNFGRIQKMEPRPLQLNTPLNRVTAAYRGIEGLQLDFVPELDGDGTQVLGDEEGLRKAASGAGR